MKRLKTFSKMPNSRPQKHEVQTVGRVYVRLKFASLQDEGDSNSRQSLPIRRMKDVLVSS